MNAKELRQMAERVDKEATRLANEAGLKCVGEHVLDCIELAIYVLSTVRDDDDEPVTEEWFRSLGMEWEETDKCFFIQNHIGITSYQGGFWFFHAEDGPGWEIKTHGQFRSLCRGLGIELKEVERV